MQITPIEFESTDGHLLAGRWFTAEHTADDGPVTVMHPATAVPQGYYDQYAEHLVGQGHTVFTYDYRGIGGSRRGSIKGDAISMSDWMFKDFRAACDQGRGRAAGRPLFYVGHSFGGHAMLRTGALHEPTGSITVASGSGYYGLAPAHLRRRRMWQLKMLMPTTARLIGYLPGWMGTSEDLPGGVAREWARRCSTPGYFTREERELIRSIMAPLEVPNLHLSVTDDTYITPEATADFVHLLPRAPTEHSVYRPEDLGASAIGHFRGFRRGAGQGLWAVMDAFFERTLSGSPARMNAHAA
ncbi:MAG: alpha/beta fold hydrolase [Bradymonadia bacterium]